MAMCYKHVNRDTDMRYVTLSLCLLFSFVSQAGVYKWIDENGKIHYSDTPVASQPSVEMNIDDSASQPSSGSDDVLSREEKRERLLQSMAEDRLEKKEQRERQKAIRQEKRAECNRYRDQMRHYERASSLYRLDAEGNRVYMSDSARARATANLRARIKKYCN